MEEQSRQNETREVTVMEPAPKKEKFGITGSTLKIIAIVSMFIDHFGAAIVEFYLYQILKPYDADYCKALICSKAPWLWMEWMGDPEKVNSLDITLRSIGRLAFPIFCFLLVEGFLHTRNMKKYLVRLGIFALVSEPFFDMAFFGKFSMDHQNVFFTLFIAVLALLAADHVKKQERFSGFHRFVDKIGILIAGVFGVYLSLTSMGRIIGMIPNIFIVIADSIGFGPAPMPELSELVQSIISGVCGFVFGIVFWLIKTGKADAEIRMRLNVGMLYVLGFFTLAELLRTDYGGWGVLAVVVMWLVRPAWMNGFTAGVLALTIMSFGEATAFISALPVEMYNGKRGLKMKYFFYLFYPLHFLLFVLIRRYLSGI